MNNKKESRYSSVLWFFLCELAVSIITVGVYLIVNIWVEGAFDYKVITGAALGTLSTSLNFFALSYTVNRAVDKYMTLRTDAEMSEEEAQKFAQENAMKVQNEVTKSYLLRTLILVAACALLFTGWFAVIPVVVPMILQRPLIVLIEKKRGGS